VPKRLTSRQQFSVFTGILEDAWHPGESIDARIYKNADLID
jgi:hypothetical protein